VLVAQKQTGHAHLPVPKRRERREEMRGERREDRGEERKGKMSIRQHEYMST
jgi:hypothetical protein